VIEQALAQLGRPGWHRAQQHRLADARLQELDALRNGRLGQAQDLGRTLEAGLLDNGRECGEQLVVEHQLS